MLFTDGRDIRVKDFIQKYTFKTKSKGYSTRYSQAVTHPSTNRARRCLTSVIGRERVYSAWYGRSRYGLTFQSTK